MNILNLTFLLLGCACAGLYGRASVLNPARAPMWALTVAACLVCAAIVDAVEGPLVAAPLPLAGAAWWLWQAWRRRRKRKRALRALGHKARARLAAMARSMPRPGPVLRPVPQGAAA